MRDTTYGALIAHHEQEEEQLINCNSPCVASIGARPCLNSTSRGHSCATAKLFHTFFKPQGTDNASLVFDTRVGSSFLSFIRSKNNAGRAEHPIMNKLSPTAISGSPVVEEKTDDGESMEEEVEGELGL